MTEHEFATSVVRQLREAGHEALFAGGSVRDMMLGIEPADFDIATSARPEDVQRIFRKTVAVGASFGVVEVLGPKPLKVQVATFRSDGPYSDGRRPDQVRFSTAREDALRRDFTINGVFFDPIAKARIDFVGGEADLGAKLLRAIGDPALRFTEDRLRLLRAVRFAARFDLAIEPTTLAAIESMAAQVISVSGERIAEELRKLLTNVRRQRGVRLLAQTGLWAAIFPESPAIDVAAIAALGNLPDSPSFPLAFVSCMNVPASAIMDRLRLSNAECDRIEWLAKNRNMAGAAPAMPFHTLKPMLAHAGIGELLALARAFGEDVSYCEGRLAEWPRETLDPPPLVTGDDLKAFGLAPGPRFKELLDQVRRAQLDGRVSTHAEAIALISPGKDA